MLIAKFCLLQEEPGFFPLPSISRNFCELGNFTRQLAFLLGMTRQLAFLLGNRRHEENRDQLLISQDLFIFYY
jgi:hypothetical protein